MVSSSEYGDGHDMKQANCFVVQIIRRDIVTKTQCVRAWYLGDLLLCGCGYKRLVWSSTSRWTIREEPQLDVDDRVDGHDGWSHYQGRSNKLIHVLIPVL